jgi:regulator of telomere elongation helicase 1
MGSFKADLKIPFYVELENPHVIRSDQVWVGAITSGPTGKQLVST